MQSTRDDESLLDVAASHLGVGIDVLMERYYGTPGDAREQLEELAETGRLQASFAQMLRRELDGLEKAPESDGSA